MSAVRGALRLTTPVIEALSASLPEVVDCDGPGCWVSVWAQAPSKRRVRYRILGRRTNALARYVHAAVSPRDQPLLKELLDRAIRFANRIPDLHHTEPHMGQDYADSTGSPVFSADTGIVIYAGWVGRSGCAVAVRSVLPDPRGLLLDSYYYHLKAGSIVVGYHQKVSPGQLLALINDSGERKDEKASSYGPHVQF